MQSISVSESPCDIHILIDYYVIGLTYVHL
jgi:hypothetical protein